MRRAEIPSITSNKIGYMSTFHVGRNETRIAVSTVVAGIMILGLAAQAQAAQTDASLIPEFDRAAGTFTGTKFLQVRYEPGSTISNLFNGRTERVEFSLRGNDNNGMTELIAAVNQALLKAQSPAQVTAANITYSGVLKGDLDSLTLTYRVELSQSFTGFKLDKNATDNIPMDVNWRGFVIEGPVIVDSAEHDGINVNQPAGLLEATFPEFAAELLGSEAADILSEPILDFREIGEVSMERWHVLFDPTFAQASSTGVIKGDFGRAKVLSVYSLGECSIREGCPPPKEADAEVTVDGTLLKLHISTPQPNSQMEIAGYTNIERAGNHEIIRVRMDNPSPIIPQFALQVLLVLGGMMGAVAAFVLIKARK